MADEKPNPIVSLFTSRKFILGMFTMALDAVIVIVGMKLNAPVEGVVTLAGTVTAIGYKLIDGIAREDAAAKGAPTNVAAGGNVTVQPKGPAPDPDRSASVPPGA